jgi:hypothetical protein
MYILFTNYFLAATPHSIEHTTLTSTSITEFTTLSVNEIAGIFC